MTKVMEKAENPLHIYSEYWMQGCGGRCPYLNRKTLKKRNKRNIFYMKKKCGRISGYMFCFFIEAGWKIKEFDMKNGE